MKVLTERRTIGFECFHSGTYQDPVSDKIRQFDIRAFMGRGSNTLRLAVECKNLRLNHPLLLSAVARTSAESFHEIISHPSPHMTQIVTMRTISAHSIYKTGEMVGKKTDQVGREEASGQIVSDDSVTFEKLNQAVNSCADLVRQVVKLPPNPPPPCFDVIVPVLVVPSDVLWQVDYSADGAQLGPPRRVRSASLFLNHAWSADALLEPVTYRMSHLEIITLDALSSTLTAWLGSDAFFDLR